MDRQQVAWLGLAIGNSRLHWGCQVTDDAVLYTWHTPHLPPEAIAQLVLHGLNFHACLAPLQLLPQLQQDQPTLDLSQPLAFPNELPLLHLISVVPPQTQQWQAGYPRLRPYALTDIPLQGLYATLGIDRAIALWGWVRQRGIPALVIDAGTALTLTGIDAQGQVGGAILPGLGLQMRSLAQGTANLPHLAADGTLPPRWAHTTREAIYSGILYTLAAGLHSYIQDWSTQSPVQLPQGAIALTGGDSWILSQMLRHAYPDISHAWQRTPQLLLEGLRALAEEAKEPD